jgi:hypothetical protein
VSCPLQCLYGITHCGTLGRTNYDSDWCSNRRSDCSPDSNSNWDTHRGAFGRANSGSVGGALCCTDRRPNRRTNSWPIGRANCNTHRNADGQTISDPDRSPDRGPKCSTHNVSDDVDHNDYVDNGNSHPNHYRSRGDDVLDRYFR